MKKFIPINIVGKKNPALFAVHDILRVEPKDDNELRSWLYLASEGRAIMVDEPASSIEEKLCKK